MRLVAWLSTAFLLSLSGCTLVYGGPHGAPDSGTPGTTDGPGEGDACMCAAPPADSCLDSSTLRSYLKSTFCTAGVCNYAYTDTTCVGGCANDACTGTDPCSSVVCDSPPNAYCASDGKTLIVFTGVGSCSGGTCAYTPTSQTCAGGCKNAACVAQANPCTGVTCADPPAAVCSGAVLVSYSPAGTCTNGTCSYTTSESSCTYGCTNGACNASSCNAVLCDEPPANTCSGTNLISYDSSGTCSNGSCKYTYAIVPCTAPANGAAVCQNAACGFVCNTGYVASNGGCIAASSGGGPCGSVTATGDCLNTMTYEYCSSGKLVTELCSIGCLQQTPGTTPICI